MPRAAAGGGIVLLAASRVAGAGTTAGCAVGRPAPLGPTGKMQKNKMLRAVPGHGDRRHRHKTQLNEGTVVRFKPVMRMIRESLLRCWCGVLMRWLPGPWPLGGTS